MNHDIPLEMKMYKTVQEEAAKTIYQSTCHFLTIDNTGNPKPHASGVFAKIENNFFLLTAGHVIDNCEDDIYIGIKQGEPLLKLGGEWVKNVPESERENDKIDAAVLMLNDKTIEKVRENYHFIGLNNIEINHAERKLPMYVSLGFPSSKSKYNPYKNELKSVPFQYVTMCADDSIYKEQGCAKNENLIVHYDKNNVLNYSSGKKTIGPDPYGISGSGLWYIPETEVLKTSNIDKKLVAIMTEWPTNNRKYWIGTRIDVFTEVIRNKYDLNIPKSKLVNVNLDR